MILCALLCINGCLIVINSGRGDYTPEAYREAYGDLNELSAEETVVNLTKALRLADFSLEIMFGADSSELSETYGEEVSMLLSEYEQGKGARYTHNLYLERILLREILQENKHCLEYQQYLDGIQKSAELMERLVVLQGKDRRGFHYRNVKKTAQFFEGWTSDGISPGPARGIEKAIDSDITDYLIVLYVFLSVMALVMREKELKQLLITRTTRNGRVRLGMGKLTAAYGIGAVTVICFYTLNLLLLCKLYGFGDLTRRIQSLSVYRSCPLKVSVAMYLVLVLVAKILAVGLWVTVFYLIAVCCASSAGMYLASIAVVGTQALLYYLGKGGALFFLLRKLNLLAFLKTDKVFKAYENLNIFGTPVEYHQLFYCLTIGGTLLLSGISLIIFAGQKGVNSVTSLWGRFTKKLQIPMHENLFIHECYKIFWHGKVFWILGAVAAGTYLYFKPLEVHYSLPEDRFYHNYMTEYEGEYTTAKHLQIENCISELDGLEGNIRMNPSEDSLSDEMRLRTIEMKRTALNRVLERAEYIKTTREGELVYDVGFLLLVGHSSGGKKDYMLALQLLLILVICVVGIYGIEYDTGMAGLAESYRRGRRELAVRKYLVAFLIATIIYMLTYGPYFYNVLHTYGTQMLGAPAYSIPELAGYSMSIGSYLILVCSVRYAGTLAAMAFVLIATKKIKRTSAAVALCTAVLVMPVLFALLGIKGAEYILLNPLLKAKLW